MKEQLPVPLRFRASTKGTGEWQGQMESEALLVECHILWHTGIMGKYSFTDLPVGVG